MLKAYLSVICASLILADMCGYHAQLSTVASDIDMISVIFIKGKSLKLHAPMSTHATSISATSGWLLRCDLPPLCMEILGVHQKHPYQESQSCG